MYLVRSNRFLCQNNVNSLNLFRHSILYYSDDKKSSDNNNDDANAAKTDNKNESKQKKDKKLAKQDQSASKSFSPETQNRLNDLLKKLSSRSTLGIVKEVQTSKPLGYKNVRKVQRLDAKETKPKNVRDAAKAVSQEFGDSNVENDILSPYKTDKKETDFLDNVISTMKTPANRQRGSQTQREPQAMADRGAQRRDDAPFKRRKPHLSQTANATQSQERKSFGSENLNINLNGNEPMGIFDKIEQLQTKGDTLNTWHKLEKNELRLRMSMAPRNYFEKMAYWTEEGKIWHFPIDNEQGLDMEMQTPFTEHVFLEEYIESWCPQKGAVHNFMELICIGLSKNPYLSVQQKREHLDWYRNYFEEKRDILQRIIEEKQNTTTQVGDGKTTETTKPAAKVSSS